MFTITEKIMKSVNFVNLQRTILPSPIKDVEIEQIGTGDLFKAYLVLDNGFKFECNSGCVGERCFGARNREEALAKMREYLKKFWTSKKLGVLVG